MEAAELLYVVIMHSLHSVRVWQSDHDNNELVPVVNHRSKHPNRQALDLQGSGSSIALPEPNILASTFSVSPA